MRAQSGLPPVPLPTPHWLRGRRVVPHANGLGRTFTSRRRPRRAPGSDPGAALGVGSSRSATTPLVWIQTALPDGTPRSEPPAGACRCALSLGLRVVRTGAAPRCIRPDRRRSRCCPRGRFRRPRPECLDRPRALDPLHQLPERHQFPVPHVRLAGERPVEESHRKSVSRTTAHPEPSWLQSPAPERSGSST